MGLWRRRGRLTGLVVLTALLSCVIFMGSLILISTSRGMEQVAARMGADLMVVPSGYEAGAGDILIKGEPCYFYMDGDVTDKLSTVSGIEKLSAQYYLTSSNQGCCDIPVQFIGIDTATDFSVLPWINESTAGDSPDELLSGHGIIVGSDIDYDEDDPVLRFFDREFEVRAGLDETGTGLDQAVFATRDTIRLLYEAAVAKGFTFPEGMNDDAVSSVMIRVTDGVDPAEVAHEIHSRWDGMQVIEAKSLSTGIADSLAGFELMLWIVMILMVAVTAVILYLVFRLDGLERRDEYKLMRSLGASTSALRGIAVGRAMYPTVPAAILGPLIGACPVFLFNTAIKSAVGIPYLLPDVYTMGLIYLSGIVMIIAVVAASSAASVPGSSKRSTQAVLNSVSEMSDTGETLKLCGITRSYISHSHRNNILKGVNLTVHHGETIAIEGVSGSGKSTLLKIMGGLLAADAGEMRINNDAQNTVSYIPQSPYMLMDMTVEDNIRLSELFVGRKGSLEKSSKNMEKAYSYTMEEIYEQLSITDILKRYPDELSGGELRRVIIARALYQCPGVILADEPTNDLDEYNKNSVIEILKKIAEFGPALVVVTHDKSVASQMSGRYVLADGVLSIK